MAQVIVDSSPAFPGDTSGYIVDANGHSSLWLRWQTGLTLNTKKAVAASIPMGVELAWKRKRWELAIRHTKGLIGLGRDNFYYYRTFSWEPYLYFIKTRAATSLISMNHFSIGRHVKIGPTRFLLRGGLATGKLDRRTIENFFSYFFLDEPLLTVQYNTVYKLKVGYLSGVIYDQDIWFSIDTYSMFDGGEVFSKGDHQRVIGLYAGGQWPIAGNGNPQRHTTSNSKNKPNFALRACHSALFSPWSGSALAETYSVGATWTYRTKWNVYADFPVQYHGNNIVFGFNYQNYPESFFDETEVATSQILQTLNMLQIGISRKIPVNRRYTPDISAGVDMYHPFHGFRFENLPGYHIGAGLDFKYLRTQLTLRHVTPQNIFLLDWSIGLQYRFYYD